MLVGFLTSLWTTRLYRGRVPRQSVWQFYVLPHMRQSWETMTSVSAGHIILTPTQPAGSGRPQRELNPGPPRQESRALPTELPRPPDRLCQRYIFVQAYGSTSEIVHSTDPSIERHLIILWFPTQYIVLSRDQLKAEKSILPQRAAEWLGMSLCHLCVSHRISN